LTFDDIIILSPFPPVIRTYRGYTFSRQPTGGGSFDWTYLRNDSFTSNILASSQPNYMSPDLIIGGSNIMSANTTFDAISLTVGRPNQGLITILAKNVTGGGFVYNYTFLNTLPQATLVILNWINIIELWVTEPALIEADLAIDSFVVTRKD
jgi:hypothetical protein